MQSLWAGRCRRVGFGASSDLRRALRAHVRLCLVVGALFIFLPLTPAVAFAGSYRAFGPEHYQVIGVPTPVTRTFAVQSPGSEFQIRIWNGGDNQQFQRVTSAIVVLNGVVVIRSADFASGGNPAIIVRPVAVQQGNEITVTLRGGIGSGITLAITGTDDLPPEIVFASPEDGDVIQTTQPAVLVEYQDNASGIDLESFALFLNGIEVTEDVVIAPGEAMFTPPTPLPLGENEVSATISDRAGNARSALVRFSIALPLPAPVLDPHARSTRDPVINIMGTALQAAEIEVAAGAGGIFEVAVENDRFSADVPLQINSVNDIVLTSIAADASRGPATTTQITNDQQPPNVFIDFPQDGDEVFESEIDVAGRVSDLLSGFDGLEVLVNGIPAIVDVGIGTNGTFLAEGVPLSKGTPTVLTAAATDVLGNSAQSSVTVSAIDIPPDLTRIAVVSGSGQVGPIHESLLEPLVARVTTGDGVPLAETLVQFKVVRSDGQLMFNPGGKGSTMIQVPTDAAGEARVFWRLGSDAGCGNNRLMVSAVDPTIVGSFEVCASATPGPAAQINVGSGNNQQLEVGASALQPLRAWVSDGCNGVAGANVLFRIVAGGGLIEGKGLITVATGPTGHAEVEFVAGGDPGNNVVQASIGEGPGQSANFVLHSIQRDPMQPTRFVSVVLDNASQPIEGATCNFIQAGQSLAETTSDAQGGFAFEGVPAGQSIVRVNGLTATAAGGQPVPSGSFPALSFDIVMVPNAENSLPRPVLLPRLNPNNARSYSTTKETELTVEGIEGLSMVVAPGSMSFFGVPMPDGTTIALNQVHHDDIPMPMPNGAAPPFAWTLQPAGAQFDPPIRITYPNMSSLAPGAIAYFLTFDHDTKRFEIVATGTATEDGLSVVSDPGSGLIEAGWGCNCPPYSVTGDCEKCPEVELSFMQPMGNPANPGEANEFNERAFSEGLPGILTVPCRATLSNGDPTRLRWRIGPIGGIAPRWTPSVPGDPEVGVGLQATATFEGLPARNDDFGLKTIRLTYEPVDLADCNIERTTTIEVFFPLLATNNPGPAPSNPPGDIQEEDVRFSFGSGPSGAHAPASAGASQWSVALDVIRATLLAIRSM